MEHEEAGNIRRTLQEPGQGDESVVAGCQNMNREERLKERVCGNTPSKTPQEMARTRGRETKAIQGSEPT